MILLGTATATCILQRELESIFSHRFDRSAAKELRNCPAKPKSAQFNEFYRQCSVDFLATSRSLLHVSTPDRTLYIAGTYPRPLPQGSGSDAGAARGFFNVG
jgi:hypothetical protein